MAQLFGLKGELEARKRALAAESEVYRQTLTLELQNLRVYGLNLKRKFAGFGTLNRLLMLVVPLASPFLHRRRPRGFRLVTTAFFVWRLGRKLVPLLQGFFRRPASGPRPAAPRSEGKDSAANI